MGVFTFEDEINSPVAPATLYKALVTDADNVIPKALDSFKSVENVEGNGGPGTIKKITFLFFSFPFLFFFYLFLLFFHLFICFFVVFS